MPQIRVLPVLPIDDAVVLPGMVVSLDMSDGEIRAAVEAARAGGSRGAPGAAVPCWHSPVRPASARHHSASRSPGPWAGRSSGSPSAACGTRRRSAVTGGPTSARCPAASSGRSARRVQ
ncbi:hypothetical protein E0F15_12530 [Frankia sp. B2]|nr:hypothetical protein E0F15_12530 [Frankia sp. B2]